MNSLVLPRSNICYRLNSNSIVVFMALEVTSITLCAGDKNFECQKCFKAYSTRGNLIRHMTSDCGQPRRHACSHCSYKAKRKDQMTSHMALRHSFNPGTFNK